MSNAIFPTFRGLTWDVKKTPNFSTFIQQGASGREVRVTKRVNPVWEFEFNYSILDDTFIDGSGYSELRDLMGFFLQRQGAYDSFLYTDPTDNSITNQSLGTGDGSTTQFQMVRNFGGFLETIQNINVITNLKVNGVTQNNPANYSINSTGLITFVTAPPNLATITTTFSYYYRLRFKEDMQDFNEFVSNLWEAQQVRLVSVKI
jgi:uncharacterized protein (TIGR02217 family)